MEAIIYSFLAGVSTILGVFLLMIFGKPSRNAAALYKSQSDKVLS